MMTAACGPIVSTQLWSTLGRPAHLLANCVRSGLRMGRQLYRDNRRVNYPKVCSTVDLQRRVDDSMEIPLRHRACTDRMPQVLSGALV